MPTVHSIYVHQLDSVPASARRIDVREVSEFNGILGRMPDSELVPLSKVLAAAESWPRDVPLLLICRSGARSMKAGRQLAERGFTSLYNLEGGMIAVNEAGLPVEGPGVKRLGAAEVRDTLCATVQKLYGPRPAPDCASFFESPEVFSHPKRQALAEALDRAAARARTDGVPVDLIDQALRPVRDQVAVVKEA
jgi:rhodanese-related sulfurtransferase